MVLLRRRWIWWRRGLGGRRWRRGGFWCEELGNGEINDEDVFFLLKYMGGWTGGWRAHICIHTPVFRRPLQAESAGLEWNGIDWGCFGRWHTDICYMLHATCRLRSLITTCLLVCFFSITSFAQGLSRGVRVDVWTDG